MSNSNPLSVVSADVSSEKELLLHPHSFLMTDVILENEHLLQTSPFWITLHVKAGERYNFSGYLRSQPGENRDAALILFDFGNYEMDEETCRLNGLKKSKVGIYSYLPVGKTINTWSFNILIPEEIGILKIGFRTWKNSRDVIIHKEINISKDVCYSKIYNELQYAKQKKRSLKLALIHEKQATVNIRKTLSFKLGYLLIHATKSRKNLFRLPQDLYQLYRNKHKKELLSYHQKEEDKNLIWKTISDAAFHKTINVIPNSQVELSGKIITLLGEKDNAALIQVDFLNLKIAKESAKRLGLRYSQKLGFYIYLPTSNPGEHDWNVSFKTPDHCKKVKLTWLPWYNHNTIQVAFTETTGKNVPKAKVEKRHIEQMAAILEKEGDEKAEDFIVNSQLLAYHKADLYEELARFSRGQLAAEVFKKAYSLDPAYDRGIKILHALSSIGMIRAAKLIIDDFDVKKYMIKPDDLKIYNNAIGFSSLVDVLPVVPRRAKRRITPTQKNVTMFLHAALPHFSNGYATRSHGILTSLKNYSEYHVEGVTRVGYPWDVNVKGEKNISDEIDGVIYHHLKGVDVSKMPMDEYIRESAIIAEQFLRDKKPQIVHSASAYTTATAALIAARNIGVPFVYEVRGLWEVTKQSTIDHWGASEQFELDKNLEALVAQNADHVITLTQGLKDELVRRGVDENNITVIPNSIDFERFKPLSKKQKLANELGLKDAVTIGYIGSIVEYEGLDDLLYALYQLKIQGIAFNFLLVGDGKAFNTIKELIVTLGLEEDVIVTGRIDHNLIEEYYSLIDIAPFPRKPLPVCEMVSPLKPFEAMALGKAIIASNVQALTEIVCDNDTGMLFEKGNVDDMVRKLRQLIEDKSLRNRLGQNARKWVSENRTWEIASKAFDAVYDQVIQQSVPQLENTLKVLVYGDLNLNYVDGSAVWAASMVEVLSGVKGLSVDFLLKARLKHTTLIEPLLKIENINIIDPDSNTMQTSEAVKKITLLDEINDYDIIVLRGFDLATEAAKCERFQGKLWPYITDVPQQATDLTDELHLRLEDIALVSNKIFCQTKYAQAFLEKHIKSSKGKTVLLRPMIPDAREPRIYARNRDKIKMVYAGKFAPLWASREMFSSFIKLRRKYPQLELHIFGDKIHNPPEDPAFKEDIRRNLEKTDGVVWHKACTRETVLEQLAKMDIAWAWRLPELELVTHELSTKVLEYGSAALPTLLMDNEINTDLLGKDYPLFARDESDIEKVLDKALHSDSVLKKASLQMFKASQSFMFSPIRINYLGPVFDAFRKEAPMKTVLVAGHDLKFIDDLLQCYIKDGYRVLTDRWQGHNRHDEAQSASLLREADIIICEWCLGNAVWYSKNKYEDQKLIVRFHRQEIETDYPFEVDMASIDQMVFVGDHFRRKAVQHFNWQDNNKLAVIGNYINAQALAQPKENDMTRFNLGIVGIVPQMKRFDRALDILEGLRKIDKRYQLFVKGKRPQNYLWMKNRPDEMKYYEEQEKRIVKSPYLRGAVHYDGFGNDMPQWYRKIGVVLSTSDFESFHLTIADGAASAALPVIIRWEGSDEIYPASWSFDTVDAAVDKISSLVNNNRTFTMETRNAQSYVQKYDINNVYEKWKKLMSLR